MSEKIFNITEPNRILGFGFIILVSVSVLVVPQCELILLTIGRLHLGGVEWAADVSADPALTTAE